MANDSWENSPEYDDWIESGGRDEDYDYILSKMGAKSITTLDK